MTPEAVVTTLTIVSGVLGILVLLGGFWFLIERTFVRKDVASVEARRLDERFDELKALLISLQDSVGSKLDERTEAAAIRGVSAGIAIERKAVSGARIPIRGESST